MKEEITESTRITEDDLGAWRAFHDHPDDEQFRLKLEYNPKDWSCRDTLAAIRRVLKWERAKHGK